MVMTNEYQSNLPSPPVLSTYEEKSSIELLSHPVNTMENGDCIGTPHLSSSYYTSPSVTALKDSVRQFFDLDDFIKDDTPVGTGYYATVYRVFHKPSGKAMALKIPNRNDSQQRFAKEMHLLKEMNHENILKYYGSCIILSRLASLTEFMEGGSLTDILQQEWIEYNWCLRVKLANDIAKGLLYLHQHSIVHRDVSSQNILIRRSEERGASDKDDSGKVKGFYYTAVVADMGLCINLQQNRIDRTSCVGHPYYTAPECLTHIAPYSPASDVFAYGLVLCEVITRKCNDGVLIPRISNYGLDYPNLSVPSGCPSWLLELAYICCQVNFHDRPDMTKVCSCLQENSSYGYTMSFVGRQRSSENGFAADMDSESTLPVSSPVISSVAPSQIQPSWNPLIQEPPKELSHSQSVPRRPRFSSATGLLPVSPNILTSDLVSRMHSLNLNAPLPSRSKKLPVIPSLNNHIGVLFRPIINLKCPVPTDGGVTTTTSSTAESVTPQPGEHTPGSLLGKTRFRRRRRFSTESVVTHVVLGRRMAARDPCYMRLPLPPLQRPLLLSSGARQARRSSSGLLRQPTPVASLSPGSWRSSANECPDSDDVDSSTGIVDSSSSMETGSYTTRTSGKRLTSCVSVNLCEEHTYDKEKTPIRRRRTRSCSPPAVGDPDCYSTQETYYSDGEEEGDVIAE